MEPADPPPAAPEDAGADDKSSGPVLTTPIIVALLSLCSVLGAALLANWDKVFGRYPARTEAVATVAPASAAGPAATELQRLHGVWLSPLSVYPYQTDRRFRLRVTLETFSGEIGGQVSDLSESGKAGAVFEIESPKPVGGGIDFHVSSTWCCEDGKEKPYQVFYQLRPTSQGLAVTRRNNVPGGGHVERFLLERGS